MVRSVPLGPGKTREDLAHRLAHAGLLVKGECQLATHDLGLAVAETTEGPGRGIVHPLRVTQTITESPDHSGARHLDLAQRLGDATPHPLLLVGQRAEESDRGLPRLLAGTDLAQGKSRGVTHLEGFLDTEQNGEPRRGTACLGADLAQGRRGNHPHVGDGIGEESLQRGHGLPGRGADPPQRQGRRLAHLETRIPGCPGQGRSRGEGLSTDLSQGHGRRHPYAFHSLFEGGDETVDDGLRGKPHLAESHRALRTHDLARIGGKVGDESGHGESDVGCLHHQRPLLELEVVPGLPHELAHREGGGRPDRLLPGLEGGQNRREAVGREGFEDLGVRSLLGPGLVEGNSREQRQDHLRASLAKLRAGAGEGLLVLETETVEELLEGCRQRDPRRRLPATATEQEDARDEPGQENLRGPPIEIEGPGS